MDGFGYREASADNAITQAHMPCWRGLLERYPHSLIQTSGPYVGLPEGVMGNSEVGHLNIGGGRVIAQDIMRISKFASEHGWDALPDLKRVLTAPGALHLLTLLSDGSVHSTQDHLYSLLETLENYPQKTVFIDIITDGRDTAPQSGAGFVAALEGRIKDLPHVHISSLSGRYYAMDRDKRWERVEKAYRVVALEPQANLEALVFSSASEALAFSYGKGVTDEFVVPCYVRGGAPLRNSDQVLFLNYRADRAREISRAFAMSDFSEFPTPVKIAPPHWLCLSQYDAQFPFPVLFPPQHHRHVLGEVLAEAGKTQLRVAETEKYAHVTYYFNGGIEVPMAGEDRVLVHSPKDVATYDLKPEMSVAGVTQATIEGMRKKYDFIAVNFANGDMVGHTGIMSAAIRAVEAMDTCLGQLVAEALAQDYELLITADHGNCEQMLDPVSQQPFTQHTTNPVYLLWVSPRALTGKVLPGQLSDIAPTVLSLMDMSVPEEMTGHNLLVEEALDLR
jgi:2,3-bisphosphoglycerate-independent phosphoglycerate mutase